MCGHQLAFGNPVDRRIGGLETSRSPLIRCVSVEALESGSPPGTIKVEDYGGTEQWGRYDSTYPEWFKGRDWAAKDAVTALKEATEIEKLGSREAKMVEYALEYMNEEKALYEFQESERKKEDGHSDKDIERVRGESEEDGIQEANDEAERR